MIEPKKPKTASRDLFVDFEETDQRLRNQKAQEIQQKLSKSNNYCWRLPDLSNVEDVDNFF